jgi:hypothetical protein
MPSGMNTPNRPGNSTPPGSMDADSANVPTRIGTKPVWVMMSAVIAAVSPSSAAYPTAHDPGSRRPRSQSVSASWCENARATDDFGNNSAVTVPEVLPPRSLMALRSSRLPAL